jgi:hypothetical protein
MGVIPADPADTSYGEQVLKPRCGGGRDALRLPPTI